VPDVLTLLGRSTPFGQAWRQLLQRDPALEALVQEVPFATADHPGEEVLPGALLRDLFRIVQSISSTRAEPVKRWLAATAADRLAETDDPELAIARARREYEHHGYPRQWIDQRMRSISARAEIVSEWHRRGARASDDYRDLTNVFVQEAFGMDVETYRQHKGLFGRENLRDHMSEAELALLSLGETVAAALHRRRGSQTLPELEKDMFDSGRIVAETRVRIEQAGAGTVIQGERTAWSQRRNPREGPGAAPSGAAPSEGREVLFRRDTGKPAAS
jgi:hypothetical protein